MASTLPTLPVPFITSAGKVYPDGLQADIRRMRPAAGRKSAIRFSQLIERALLAQPQDPAIRRIGRCWVAQNARKKDGKLGRAVAQLEFALATTSKRKAKPSALAHPYNQARMEQWEQKGLSKEAFIEIPELWGFIESEHFDKQIAFYDGKIKTAPDGTPMLKMEGSYHPWMEVTERIRKEGPKHWAYREEGFVHWEMNDWTELKPFAVLPESERPKTHVFELCTGSSLEHPGCFSEHGHNWSRLICPTGEVYSIGFYPPDDFLEDPKHPLVTLPGIIQVPDVYEFLPNQQIERVVYPISEKAFKDLKCMLEQWQRLGIHYNALDQNCSDFAKCILLHSLPEKQRTDLEKTMDLSVSWFHELPQWMQNAWNGLWAWVPGPLKRVGAWTYDRVITLLLSPLALYLGARRPLEVSSDKENGTWKVPALIEKLSDIFSLSITLNHTRGVRRWQRTQENYVKGPRFAEARARLEK